MAEQDRRAERAARDYLAREAANAGFSALDPATLRARAARRRRRWTGGGLAAAACLLAAVVVVPLALGGLPSRSVPAAPAPPAFTWTKTAPSPLAPRFGSLAAWLDGRFYLIGGWTGGAPCPPGAMCDMAPPDAADGARYDPASGTWSDLADAPVGLGTGYDSLVTLDDTLYVATSDGKDLVYDPAANSWTRVDAVRPPGQVVSTGRALFSLVSESAPVGAAFQRSTATWEPLPAGPLDDCTDRRGLAADGRLLVLGTCDEKLALSFFDPAAARWGDLQLPEDAIAGLDPVYVAGRLVWPDQLAVTSSATLPGLYDTASRSWVAEPPSEAPGGLAFKAMPVSEHLVLDGAAMVAANGSLLDVRRPAWLTVPEAPVAGRWAPVVVAGSTSLLSCFGYVYEGDPLDRGGSHPGSYSPACFLGSVNPGQGSVTPTMQVPSTSPSSEPASLAWVTTKPPLGQRSDPLMVAAAGRYYVIGGHDGNGQLWDGAGYDPRTGTWKAIAPLPGSRPEQPWNLAASVVGDLVYVRLSFEEQGELLAYDTGSDTWTKLGPTDETETYVGTADGLVKFRGLNDPGSLPPQVLEGGSWRDLPPSPLPSGGSVRVFGLDDHSIGLETGGRVAVLHTGTRQWSDPSAPGDTSPELAFGTGGVAVFASLPDQETEALHNNKQGLVVVTYGEAGWRTATPLASDGGLGAYTGPSSGHWAVVAGNLYDPAEDHWLQVPAMPGSDFLWNSRDVAAGPEGVLSCYPFALDIATESRTAEDGCFFLPLA